MNDAELDALHRDAYDAFDKPDLPHAVALFTKLIAELPDEPHYWYMRGLAHKYLRQWRLALADNLRRIELDAEESEGAIWNAGIAATALADRAEARRLWSLAGIRLPPENELLQRSAGSAVVRLNPWMGGETVWVTRIDPVRARIENVPLPESGHRYGDIVLHDGARTGARADAQGRQRPVFNELERLEASEFRTFVAFVTCPTRDALDALFPMLDRDGGLIEDWTESVGYICLRCSYGVVHRHEGSADGEWQQARTIGVAAKSGEVAERIVREWSSRGEGRAVDAIETRECEPPGFNADSAWWAGPDEDDADSGDSQANG